MPSHSAGRLLLDGPHLRVHEAADALADILHVRGKREIYRHFRDLLHDGASARIIIIPVTKGHATNDER
jgi:hypothetical protein